MILQFFNIIKTKTIFGQLVLVIIHINSNYKKK